MDKCPECGGLLIEDNDEDAYMLTPDISMYCSGCGWCSDDEYENEDYNEDPDFEVCPSCNGRGGHHKPACSEDDAIYY